MRYVARYAYTYTGEGYTPVPNGEPPLYLHKSVSVSRRSGSLRYAHTTDIEQARTWATRAGIMGYLADKFTYTNPALAAVGGCAYIIEEVTA